MVMYGFCRGCHNPLVYVYVYDAYACIVCNEWKEGTCSDPRCDFCVGRPETPLGEKMYNELMEIYREKGFDEMKKVFREMEEEV